MINKIFGIGVVAGPVVSGGVMPVSVASGHYLRTEVYDASGVLLGFSNLTWVLPEDTDVDIPGRRGQRL